MATVETRDKILQAAGPVFAELGLEKATVRDICASAEVNLASVNYHFGSKEQLYIEVVRYLHRRRIEENPLPDWPPGTPAESRLRDFIANLMAFMFSDEGTWEARLMRREMLNPTQACAESVEDFIRPHFGMMQGIIEEIAPGLPLHRRQQFGFSVIGQCVFYKFHREVVLLLIPEPERAEHFQPQQLADHITDVVLTALRSHQP
ncbi:MAG: TetR/AcrR family transcriptional regulator [Planctomycetaceae bacterium]